METHTIKLGGPNTAPDSEFESFEMTGDDVANAVRTICFMSLMFLEPEAGDSSNTLMVAEKLASMCGSTIAFAGVLPVGLRPEDIGRLRDMLMDLEIRIAERKLEVSRIERCDA